MLWREKNGFEAFSFRFLTKKETVVHFFLGSFLFTHKKTHRRNQVVHIYKVYTFQWLLKSIISKECMYQEEGERRRKGERRKNERSKRISEKMEHQRYNWCYGLRVFVFRQRKIERKYLRLKRWRSSKYNLKSIFEQNIRKPSANSFSQFSHNTIYTTVLFLLLVCMCVFELLLVLCVIQYRKVEWKWIYKKENEGSSELKIGSQVRRKEEERRRAAKAYGAVRWSVLPLRLSNETRNHWLFYFYSSFASFYSSTFYL